MLFWQQCQWDQNCKGFLLLQRGSIMLNFSKTQLLKRFMPVAMNSLLVFAYKSKVAKACGYDCLNCKHQPNVCKFLLGLDNCFLNWCRKMWIKNVQHSLRILGFALRYSPSLHLHFIIHPVLFILCLSDVKRVISSHHSSCIYCPFIHRIINLFM